MKKTLFILLISFIVIGLSVKVSATAPPPTPKCYIKGVIKSVEFKEAYDHPCVQNPPCPTDTQLHYPDRYYLTVNIQEVSYVSGETSFQTCKDLYPLDSEQQIFINKEKVKEGDTFKENQKIEGQVSSFWGKSFDSYTLQKSKDTPAKVPVCPEGEITYTCLCGKEVFSAGFCCNNQPQKQPCVSEMVKEKPPCPDCVLKPEIKREKDKYIAKTKEYELISKEKIVVEKDKLFVEKNGIKKELEIKPDIALDIVITKHQPKRIEKIELYTKDNKPIYKIKAKKSFKLFGLFNIGMKVESQIDAETGQIIKEKKPWWRFFGIERASPLMSDSMGFTDEPCRLQCRQEFRQCAEPIILDDPILKKCTTEHWGNLAAIRQCVLDSGGSLEALVPCNEQRVQCIEECGGVPTGESHFGWYWAGEHADDLSILITDLGLNKHRVENYVTDYQANILIKENTVDLCEQTPECSKFSCELLETIPRGTECWRIIENYIQAGFYDFEAANNIIVTHTLTQTQLYLNDYYGKVSDCKEYRTKGGKFFCSPFLPIKESPTCKNDYDNDGICSFKDEYADYLIRLTKNFDGDCDINDDGDCSDSELFEDSNPQGTVKRYAIFNEFPLWNGDSDTPVFSDKFYDDYFDFVSFVYDIIKSNCPDCEVGIGVSGIYTESGDQDAIIRYNPSCENIDFIDSHLITGYGLQDDGGDTLEFREQGVAELRTVCPNIPLISGESSSGLWMPYTEAGEKQQAEELIKVFANGFSLGFDEIDYQDIGASEHFECWNNGLYYPCEDYGCKQDGYPKCEKKQAYTTLKVLSSKLDYFTIVSKLDEGQYKFTFSSKNPVYVLWCDSVPCSVPFEITGTVKVTDYLGNEETKDTGEIILSESPVFVEKT